jgi:hypothetical protein
VRRRRLEPSKATAVGRAALGVLDGGTFAAPRLVELASAVVASSDEGEQVAKVD